MRTSGRIRAGWNPRLRFPEQYLKPGQLRLRGSAAGEHEPAPVERPRQPAVPRRVGEKPSLCCRPRTGIVSGGIARQRFRHPLHRFRRVSRSWLAAPCSRSGRDAGRAAAGIHRRPEELLQGQRRDRGCAARRRRERQRGVRVRACAQGIRAPAAAESRRAAPAARLEGRLRRAQRTRPGVASRSRRRRGGSTGSTSGRCRSATASATRRPAPASPRMSSTRASATATPSSAGAPSFGFDTFGGNRRGLPRPRHARRRHGGRLDLRRREGRQPRRRPRARLRRQRHQSPA